jgi:hypothetical protein
LNFGAVDWQATVFVNGKEVGKHEGGYTSFSLDITDALKDGENELIVKVYDPTDQGPNPRGKQILNPKDIWYTPTTGIWQTVWLEEVPAIYIESIKMTTDIDKGTLHLKVNIAGKQDGYYIVTSIGNKNNKMPWDKFEIDIPIDEINLWSPGNPFLYDLTISLYNNEKAVDEVKTYFGMRKVEIKKDANGHERIYLNNKYVFNLGTLDQGFWPDGIYTAPTDEALAFDIKAIKQMGFNMIRKHIKVEPARWYYHCDKIGMIVWQDLVNPSFDLTSEAKTVFEKECKETIEQLYNYPSITTWTLFNEKWGQYDQERLSKWIKKLDPTRLLNGHSGEILYVNEKLRSPSPNAWINSDITDIHSYPDPMNAPKMDGKARILGEFGGIGVFIPDHQWNTNSAWGYINVTPGQLKGKYTIMNQHLKLLEKEGLSASIYTQPFDVEGEQNGLMTYDRAIVKIPFKELQEIHRLLVPTATNIKEVTAKNADLTEPTQAYAGMLHQYINGKRDAAFVKKLAMMAGQTNDAAGKIRFNAEYIALLKAPFTSDDIQYIQQFTKTTKDAGFTFMRTHAEQFKKVLGERPYTIAMMNMIYNGEIDPLLNASAKPDWTTIEHAIKQYGAEGEEIYLRAKLIHCYNSQDWANYVPTAKDYLEKYKKNIPETEQKMFQEAIDKHQQ